MEVNAVGTKLEKPEVQDLLLHYDLVSLNETKTETNVSAGLRYIQVCE